MIEPRFGATHGDEHVLCALPERWFGGEARHHKPGRQPDAPTCEVPSCVGLAYVALGTNQGWVSVCFAHSRMAQGLRHDVIVRKLHVERPDSRHAPRVPLREAGSMPAGQSTEDAGRPGSAAASILATHQAS